MKEAPWFSLLGQAVLTAALTVITTLAINQHVHRQEQQANLVKEAEVTASSTIAALYESQERLDELIATAQSKGWKELSKNEWAAYRVFRNQWRRGLISSHFKVQRYFGRDAAAQIVHVEEIDLAPVPENLGSPSMCTPVGKYDLLKLADHIECEARWRAISNDILKESDIRGALEQINHNSQIDEALHARTRQYDKAIVSLIRALDKRLSAIGKEQVLYVSE